MIKITKKKFKEIIENLHIDGEVSPIKNEHINEFKIGKNFFYALKESDELIKIQKYFNDIFQESIPLNNAAVAFRKNLCYLHLFEPHRKNYHFIRLDIKSFFHSINIEDIKAAFQKYFITEDDLTKDKIADAYIDENKTQTLIDAFINLVTYKIPENSDNEKFNGKQVLPMGFISSPVISNIIFRKLDIQIQKFCAHKNIKYTRYADDMLFSTDINMSYIHSNNFINEMGILLSQMNFKINKKKTIKAKHTLSINGYTIQYATIENSFLNLRIEEEKLIHEMRLSNKRLMIIKKLIYLIETINMPAKEILKKLFNYQLPPNIPREKIIEYHNHQIINKLTGYRSYLLSLLAFNKKYNCCQKNTIDKYIDIIKNLNNIIEKFC